MPNYLLGGFMHRSLWLRLSVAVMVCSLGLVVSGAAGQDRLGTLPQQDEAATRLGKSYGLLPLSFEINRGQTDARVSFLPATRSV